MDFGETLEEWCETGAEKCNFDLTSVPLVDPSISRKGLVPDDFTISTRKEFAKEEEADTALKQLRNWIESKHSLDELAGLRGRINSLAQPFDQT